MLLFINISLRVLFIRLLFMEVLSPFFENIPGLKQPGNMMNHHTTG